MKMQYTKGIFILLFITAICCTKGYSISLDIKYQISGIVKDSLNGQRLPFASVQLLSANNSSLVKGTMTDTNGKYQISNVKSGEYILISSYMGYTECKKTLTIQSNKTKCNFSLVQKTIALSEISVNADRNLIEKSISKTVVNVSKNATVTGGTATDVMQTLPSVDIDIDGNINYRGSDKVLILINGEKSELVKSLDQIPANQIAKVELINNPSAKYEAEGMSGIINLVLISGKAEKNKTTLLLQAGHPETFGGNVGYSGTKGKTHFFINGGIKHSTKFQIKEHLRENYGNSNALNYYQYDRQDENQNDAFLNSNLDFSLSPKQRLGVSLIASKKFNNSPRTINYETLNKTGETISKSLKEINIDLNNSAIDGSLNYKYSFEKGRILSSKIHYSYFDQLQEMNNKYYQELADIETKLQNTFSEQINKKTDFVLNYLQPLSSSTKIEAGYNFSEKNLTNDFRSESLNDSKEWVNDIELANKFNYNQLIHAVYFNLNGHYKAFELQAGIRGEATTNQKNNKNTNNYFDFYPSVNISRKMNKNLSFFAGYNRRINRPTIKMLNPFAGEYADDLNRHKGNPNLKPEYVNSIEFGNRFVFQKLSGLASVYFRNIDQAITRVKSASDESALFVTYINLEKAILTGGEISLSYKPFRWWSIISNSNIFYTALSGQYKNNLVDNNKTGWSTTLSNNFKLPDDFGFQFSGYFRSKLPSVMGTYKERYYCDLALNKKLLKNKAQLVFKISDVFNSYKFAFDLDGIDDNNFKYSQKNKRKNESQYFVLSFIYNINGKNQQKKKQKENFFLDGFEK